MNYPEKKNLETEWIIGYLGAGIVCKQGIRDPFVMIEYVLKPGLWCCLHSSFKTSVFKCHEQRGGGCSKRGLERQEGATLRVFALYFRSSVKPLKE